MFVKNHMSYIKGGLQPLEPPSGSAYAYRVPINQNQFKIDWKFSILIKTLHKSRSPILKMAIYIKPTDTFVYLIISLSYRHGLKMKSV